MLQRLHSGQKTKEKEDALPLHQITQLDKFNIPRTIVIKHQKHLSTISAP